MIKSYLKKFLPDAGKLQQDASLTRIQGHISNPFLWSINRKSIARGVAIGLFIAFVPLPLQMLMAAILAIYFGANLPIAVALTWVTNPITFVPLNYFIYRVGRLVISDSMAHSQVNEIDFSWHMLRDNAHYLIYWAKNAGKPFLVGLPIVAIGASIFGYIFIQVMWRLAIYIVLKKRKKRAA